MDEQERVRAGLGSALQGAADGLAAADALCRACVDLLGVDGAAISLMHKGASRGTFGSSGELSRRLDELQFTYGEGPCLDAVRSGRPVLVDDLAAAGEHRWPVFAGAVLEAGVRAVFALPVTVVSAPIGAIDLFCHQPGRLQDSRLDGALQAAQLAALPLLDLVGDASVRGADGEEARWSQVASLERVEVYQATGMIMAQMDVSPAEALVRLRGYAFSHDKTASEVAWDVVARKLTFKDGDSSGSSR